MKEKLKIAAAASMVIVILAVVVTAISGEKRKTDLPLSELLSEEPETQKETKAPLLPEKVSIKVEILEDKLENTGKLVTQEYWFKDVVQITKNKTFIFNLSISESSCLATYEGVAAAGIDLSLASVKVDNDAQTVTVHLPRAEVQSVTIDHESFTLHSEKDGWLTDITASDYNNGLVELEKRAKSEALDRGILKKADEQAAAIVSNLLTPFIDTLAGDAEFRLIIEQEGEPLH